VDRFAWLSGRETPSCLWPGSLLEIRLDNRPPSPGGVVVVDGKGGHGAVGDSTGTIRLWWSLPLRHLDRYPTTEVELCATVSPQARDWVDVSTVAVRALQAKQGRHATQRARSGETRDEL